MSIPILSDINKELTRLCVAGSSLGIGDPRIKKYIPILNKMGEKATVFKALALKLEGVVSEKEDSSKSTIEALTILYSILYTQGSTNTDSYNNEVNFSDNISQFRRLQHSRIKAIQELIKNKPKGQEKEFIEIYNLNLHNDIRLYDLYCDSISEHRTPISNYLEEILIPSIGRDIVPFIEERLNIRGNKKDARLLNILHKIIGKEILPLSIKAIEEGTKDLIVQAIYTLYEDEKYEDKLLLYTTNKVSDIKSAAFYSLAKMESKKGEELLLISLGKANIDYLYKGLEIIKNPKVISIIISEIEKEMTKREIRNVKVISLLEILAKRNEKEGLDYIENIFVDLELYRKFSDKINIEQVVKTLQSQDNEEKNNILYKIYNKNIDFTSYAIKIDINSEMSKEKVYEKYYKLFIEESKNKSYLHNCLCAAYKVFDYSYHLDCDKEWDRRWAKLFLEINDTTSTCAFIYDNDEETWSKLLEIYSNRIGEGKNKKYYELHYANILSRAFNNNHPECEKYYKTFIEKGYKEEVLINNLKGYGIDVEVLN